MDCIAINTITTLGRICTSYLSTAAITSLHAAAPGNPRSLRMAPSTARPVFTKGMTTDSLGLESFRPSTSFLSVGTAACSAWADRIIVVDEDGGARVSVYPTDERVATTVRDAGVIVDGKWGRACSAMEFGRGISSP